VSDKTKKYTWPSIFGLLSKKNVSWAIYGYVEDPLTRQNLSDTT
jgi:phospholipase C